MGGSAGVIGQVGLARGVRSRPAPFGRLGVLVRAAAGWWVRSVAVLGPSVVVDK